MKKLLITMAAGLMIPAMIPAVTMAQEIEGGVAVYDANSDRYYSVEEIQAAYPTATRAAVARTDRNGDGIVVAEELARAVRKGYFVRS